MERPGRRRLIWYPLGMTRDPAKRGGWDRSLTMATLIAAAVLIFRGILIAHFHGPTFDENYHLYRGLLFLRQDFKTLRGIRLNDPPLGEALLAVPAWLNGQHLSDPLLASAWSHDLPPPAKFCYVLPDHVRIETAIWKSLLFLPGVAVIFVWVRSIYSAASAWLALAMVLTEPTLAALVPLPTPDGLAVEGIVIGAWAVWRFVAAPTVIRQVQVAATVAVAMLLKPSGILLPAVAVVLAMVHWRLRDRADLPGKVKSFLVASALVPVVIWVLLLGDVSAPFKLSDRAIFRNGPFRGGIPAGLYVESVWDPILQERAGQTGYLLGKTSLFGWWYYFPVVATYKVPIGMGIVAVLALASAWRIKPRYEEFPLAVCAVAWTAATMLQYIDIGFRHFLPAEIFLLMLCSRVLAEPGRIRPIVAWLAVAAGAIDVAAWTPDYLSYVNFPRQSAYLDISDSNVDWGQGTKQVRRWIEARPADGRSIYLAYFGPLDQDLFQQIGPRLTEYLVINGSWIARPEGCADPVVGLAPDHGLLILSPVELTGQYDPTDRFARLRRIPPDQVIGHCLLVYDLDRLRTRAGR
ncbi:MAG: hypothetical protein ABSH08_14775 [Tepidisphaeraceae bacterium]